MKYTGQNLDSTGSERRRGERRASHERRGSLRWDPLSTDRRNGDDRRRTQSGANGQSH